MAYASWADLTGGKKQSSSSKSTASWDSIVKNTSQDSLQKSREYLRQIDEQTRIKNEQEAKKQKVETMQSNIQKNLEDFQKTQELGIDKNASFWENTKRNFTAVGSKVANYFGQGVSTPQMINETPEYAAYRVADEKEKAVRAEEMKAHPIISSFDLIMGGPKELSRDIADVHYFNKNIDESWNAVKQAQQEFDEAKKGKNEYAKAVAYNKLQSLTEGHKTLIETAPEAFKKTNAQIGATAAMAGIDVLFSGILSGIGKTAAKVVGEDVAKTAARKMLGENLGREIFNLSAKEMAEQTFKQGGYKAVQEFVQKETTQKVLQYVGNKTTAEIVGLGSSYAVAEAVKQGETDTKALTFAAVQGAAFGWILDRALIGTITAVKKAPALTQSLYDKAINKVTTKIEDKIGRPVNAGEDLLIQDAFKKSMSPVEEAVSKTTPEVAAKNALPTEAPVSKVEVPKKTATAKVENSLSKEAKKYKSAEEFAVARGNSEASKVRDEIISMYKKALPEISDEVASTNANRILQGLAGDSKSLSSFLHSGNKTARKIVSELTGKKWGKDINQTILKNGQGSLLGGVLEKRGITKSQLTDIWNKANAEVEKAVEKKSNKSLVGKTIEAKTIEKKLTEGFKDTAEYTPTTIKEQSKKVSDIINEGDKKIKDIISGKEKLPSDVRTGSFIAGVEEYATKKGDAELLEKLANSPLTAETSLHAQELRMLAERNPDSILSMLQGLKKAKLEGFQKRLKSGVSERKVINTAKKETGKAMGQYASKKTWTSLVEELKCK